MLRLHVVLNSSDGDEMLRQPDLAVLTGKAAGSREQAMDILMAEHRTSGRVSEQIDSGTLLHQCCCRLGRRLQYLYCT
jgi:hypothetical protein